MNNFLRKLSPHTTCSIVIRTHNIRVGENVSFVVFSGHESCAVLFSVVIFHRLAGVEMANTSFDLARAQPRVKFGGISRTNTETKTLNYTPEVYGGVSWVFADQNDYLQTNVETTTLPAGRLRVTVRRIRINFSSWRARECVCEWVCVYIFCAFSHLFIFYFYRVPTLPI